MNNYYYILIPTDVQFGGLLNSNAADHIIEEKINDVLSGPQGNVYACISHTIIPSHCAYCILINNRHGSAQHGS